MEYKELQRKKTLLQQRKAAMPKELLAHMEQEFENQFTYDSLALSGSTLTREEIKAILADERQRENTEKETE